jgi:hypothetical protein
MRGPHPKLNLTATCNSIALQQTNTADMLDLAVDYIKELQDQVKVRANYPIKMNFSGKKRETVSLV